MKQSPFRLDGKKILITGASSGIGRQIAITASEAGAEIILTARSEKNLNETQSQLEGNNHQVLPADLLLENDIKSLVENIPKIDGLVHCAGWVKSFPIKYLDAEKIKETFDLNFNSVVNLTAAIGRNKKFSKNSSVVFISSISGQYPHIGGSMYGSSKAAIETFSKVLALENQSIKLRSNCISPAMVKTPLFDAAAEDMSKELMEDHISQYPLGVGEPEDVANAALFLLSDASKWVSGINLILDGGYLLLMG